MEIKIIDLPMITIIGKESLCAIILSLQQEKTNCFFLLNLYRNFQFGGKYRCQRKEYSLDLVRWKYLFGGGSKEDVLTALAAYQNDNGGQA